MNPKDRLLGSNLIALGSAAVIAVYSAGYFRTRSAAQQFAVEDVVRRPAAPSTGNGDARVVTSPSISDAGPAAAPAETATEPSATPTRKATSTPSSTPPAVVSARDTTVKAADTAKPVAVAVITPEPVAPPTDSSATATAVTADSAAQQKEAARPQFVDGTFTGYGTSRHGDIEATVEIKNGRIASASISRCLTRYSCSWISALPGQVVSRQSAEVDYVSGATQSSNAFYQAVVEALKKAK